MRVWYSLFVWVCLYEYTEGGVVPFIKPCRATDSACLKSSAQAALPVLAAGVPSLGISVLDPMTMDQVTISQAGLEVDLNNTAVTGLRNCQIQDIKREVDKMYIDLQCSVVMTGDYNVGGNMLYLPIEGSGTYKININDIIVKIEFDIEHRVVNDVKYWSMSSWNYAVEVETGVEFNFQNLFNGNEELSEMVHDLANYRWKDIFEEVASPIVQAIVEKIMQQIKLLFNQVPEDQLVLPDL